MSAKARVRTQVQYRNSVSGEFATKKEADKKPREHEREVIKHPK
jgi:hypothetical protein